MRIDRLKHRRLENLMYIKVLLLILELKLIHEALSTH